MTEEQYMASQLTRNGELVLVAPSGLGWLVVITTCLSRSTF